MESFPVFFRQLARPLPVFLVGKGNASAIGLIEHEPGCGVQWVSVLEDSGETLSLPDHMVRLRDCWPEENPEVIADTLPSSARRIALAGADDEHSAFP